MIYLGVDPGKNGGLAAIKDGILLTAIPMGRDEVLHELRMFKEWGDGFRCCIEKVHAMPHQGSVSMFTFGENYGWLKGVFDAYRIPYQEVTPQKWKKEFSLGRDKKQSIEVCKQLFPGINLRPIGKRVDHDGMAEAALMAEYARRKF